nr:MAG TPA: hypothetical protein [Caudoviricetes sp.]
MVEVIPVQALAVVSGLESAEVVINLIPVLVYQDGLNTVVGKVADIVNNDNMTSELRLIHMERSSQHIDIHTSVEVGSCNEVLVFLGSRSPNTSVVHGVVEDGHAVGHGLNLNHCLTSGRSIGNSGDRLNNEPATLAILGNQLLHKDELIQSSGFIHAVNQSSNEAVKAVIGQKRLAELLIGNGQRIVQLAVHGVEHGENIREVALEQSVLRSTGVIGLRLDNINIDLLDGFTNSKAAFLEGGQRVRSHTVIEDNQPDTVNQCINELVCLRFKIENSITNIVNILGSSFGDSILIHSGAIGSDSIKQLYAVSHYSSSFPV